MSNNLVMRLRSWEHVYPEDENKAEGSLYLEAADRIEELEKKIHEETDDGRVFRPNVIRSCRVLDAEKLDQVLVELKRTLEDWG